VPISEHVSEVWSDRCSLHCALLACASSWSRLALPARTEKDQKLHMKLITIEEHTMDEVVAEASAARWHEVSPHFNEAFAVDSGLPYCPPAEVLGDLGEGRIADMDAHGIDMQVLSYLSTQYLPADAAPAIVREVNDVLATACNRHPDRFAAFASLPTSAPEQAPDELKRAVGELGHVGTMIHGRTDDEFLSAERFDPILRVAAELEVPIYLHPAPPTRSISVTSYEARLDPIVAARFATPESTPCTSSSAVLKSVE
jgi:predicted TIM-barrel fold metal-dependent hydrolase